MCMCLLVLNAMNEVLDLVVEGECVFVCVYV